MAERETLIEIPKEQDGPANLEFSLTEIPGEIFNTYRVVIVSRLGDLPRSFITDIELPSLDPTTIIREVDGATHRLIENYPGGFKHDEAVKFANDIQKEVRDFFDLPEAK